MDVSVTVERLDAVYNNAQRYNGIIIRQTCSENGTYGDKILG